MALQNTCPTRRFLRAEILVVGQRSRPERRIVPHIDFSPQRTLVYNNAHPGGPIQKSILRNLRRKI